MNQNQSISNQLTLKCTTVFEKQWNALNSDCRFIRHQGGSRSSKTYSICQSLILYCLQNPKKLVSIVRKTGPALTASVYRDFINILKDMNLYTLEQHKKGAGMYEFPNGSAVEFFSVSDEQKLRGRKRDIAFINECTEISYEEFQQIALRTTDKLIVDYNPSSPDSYLYELPSNRTVSIHSTYKDNAFLEKQIIEQIESYKYTDDDYYQIFCLGNRCFSRENVFNQWEQITKPEHFVDFIYAIDYGYTHPTAMTKIWYTPNSREVFVEELIYESYLTSIDIIERLEQLGVSKSHAIISETARPEIIADLKRAGYSIIPAIKDVKDGIANMKTFKIQIDSSASNLIKENFNYRYQKLNGKLTENAVKLWDDLIDSLRYGMMYIKKYKLKETNQNSQVYSFNF